MLPTDSLRAKFPLFYAFFQTVAPFQDPTSPTARCSASPPSGIIGYNCNYENFPPLAEGKVFDQQT